MCIASTRAAAPGIAYPLSCVQWKHMLSPRHVQHFNTGSHDSTHLGKCTHSPNPVCRRREECAHTEPLNCYKRMSQRLSVAVVCILLGLTPRSRSDQNILYGLDGVSLCSNAAHVLVGLHRKHVHVAQGNTWPVGAAGSGPVGPVSPQAAAACSPPCVPPAQHPALHSAQPEQRRSCCPSQRCPAAPWPARLPGVSCIHTHVGSLTCVVITLQP